MLGAEAESRGMKARIMAFNDMDLEKLTAALHPVVVFVAASTGDGDPPDNTARFWVSLRRAGSKGAAKPLAGVRFCSMGLGDSNYTRFMNVPRVLNRLFQDLGATCFYRNGEADEVDGIDDIGASRPGSHVQTSRA